MLSFLAISTAVGAKVQPKSKAVSIRMKGNTSSGTQPELLLLAHLKKNGIKGYRKNYRTLTGKPDIVFTREKITVFMHGCFWHLCPHCKPPIPKHNRAFWEQKLYRNKERDKTVRRELRNMGWKVLVIWECQLQKNAQRQIERLQKLINAR